MPTQPSINWVSRNLLPGVKWPVHEADHSPPSSAEAKNGGAIPQLWHTSSWHSVKLIKHRDNFTFTLYRQLLLSHLYQPAGLWSRDGSALRCTPAGSDWDIVTCGANLIPKQKQLIHFTLLLFYM
jgi:hypothetical protein